MSASLSAVIGKLPGARRVGEGKYQAKCPGHEDRVASLSVSEGEGGRVLVHCHAGCTRQHVLSRIGMSDRDLFPNEDRPHNSKANGNARVVKVYPYRDETGRLLYEVQRLEPKGFRQRRPDGNGGHIFNVEGVRRVPYRLPELIKSDPTEWVYIVEGEKDADALAEIHLTATCNVGGALKWRDEYNEHFRDLKVAIIGDNDKAGRDHSIQVATAIESVAREVRIINLPGVPEKGDVSDYLAEHDPIELLELVDNTPAWKPDEETESLDSQIAILTARELVRKFPELRREIIFGLLREGETANLIAASKRGKTYLALYVALCVCAGRCIFDQFQVSAGKVLYIDCELHPNTLGKRIATIADAMGLTADEYADNLHVLSLRGQLTDVYGLGRVFKRFTKGEYQIVFLDALYRLIPAGVDENSNSEMTALYNAVDKYADELATAFLIVHHASKGSQAHKSVTDIGAGAGAMSRATDSHLALREHEQDDAVVMEAACRSFPPIQPICLRWNFPLWEAAQDLNPADLKQPGGRRQRKEQESDEPADVWNSVRFAVTFATDNPTPKNALLAKASAAIGSGRKAEKLLALAEMEGHVHRWTLPRNRMPHYATIPQPKHEVQSGEI